jgi:hypothetical protein
MGCHKTYDSFKIVLTTLTGYIARDIIRLV